jgi:hypothetical protein
MRRRTIQGLGGFGWLAATMLVLSGCGSDDMALSEHHTHWQLRCPQSGMGVCTTSGIPRVFPEDDDRGYETLLQCQVSNLDDDRKRLNLRVEQRGGSGLTSGALQLEDVHYLPGQSATAGRITVTEGSDTFRGLVGAGEPCEVNDVRVERIEGGRALLLDVLCRDMSDPISPSRMRDLTSATSIAFPASVVVFNCPGM